jgi:predicted nuclease of predicted toxin-antitoxin system
VTFLPDQDVFEVTARFLRGLGHDVVKASELGLSRAPGFKLLAAAKEASRILVTRDRDFGELVFLGELKTGVLFLRISPATASGVHEELRRVISIYGQSELMKAFTVVEPGRHRLRRLPFFPARPVGG